MEAEGGGKEVTFGWTENANNMLCDCSVKKLKSCKEEQDFHVYPPCPQPESAMGMPPHSDQFLMTQNSESIYFNRNKKIEI